MLCQMREMNLHVREGVTQTPPVHYAHRYKDRASSSSFFFAPVRSSPKMRLTVYVTRSKHHLAK